MKRKRNEAQKGIPKAEKEIATTKARASMTGKLSRINDSTGEL